MTGWDAAVSSGNATALVDLMLASTASPAQTLEVLRRCVSLCEAKLNGASHQHEASRNVGGPKTDGTAETDGSATTAKSIESDPGAWTKEALCTLPGVQLLHPRGRFDMEFRNVGVSISGKAGAATLAWENVRHLLRLPRPEGYAWGKMDSADPAGSDLLAAPLKEPVAYRKTTLSLVVIQPDPKAKQPEVSLSVEGVSHKVAGSQGTVIMELLKLLMPTMKLAIPDRLSFLSRDSKSFIKCYHGVHEGSLFPLNQGLLFMKPGLFLPLDDIEEVVCGRGGSAQTRYVDLVVTMQASSGAGDGEKGTREEFSNINRDDLSSLQHYIQTALVAPRQREAKRAEKARKAEGTPPVIAPSVTVDRMERGNGRSGERSGSENGNNPGAGSTSSARSGSQREANNDQAVGDGGEEENQDSARPKATSRSCALLARNAISQRQVDGGEDDEDEEDEEDETFEPQGSDGDSSGDDSGVDGDGGDVSDDGEEDYEEDPDDAESDDGEGGDQSDRSVEGACQSGSRPKRPRAAAATDGEDDRPSRGTSAADMEEDGGGEGANDDGDKTDSDDGARSHPAKRAK